MQIDQLKLALRRRNPWEALDLGLIMLRHWRGPIYRVWFATFVPFSLLILALLWQHPTIAFLVIWWLKPLFDRLLLKAFAEASFGAPPTVREVWQALPRLLRHSGLIAGLSFRRFNISRSFDLPVWQLEAQAGKSGRARLRVLSRKTGSYAAWLTIVCLHIVAIFEFGFVGLIQLLIPSDGLTALSWADVFFGESSETYALLFNLSWLLAESIVEPYYVGAGFSLYLNRRSELEGWDIEVTFRRMSERQRQTTPSTPPSLQRTLMIALFAGGLAWAAISPRHAQAQEQAAGPLAEELSTLPQATPIPPRKPDGQIKKLAEKVLADPLFGQKIEELSWRPRQQDEAPEEKASWEDSLVALANLLAKGTRGVLYVLIGLACVVLLVVLYRHRHLLPGVSLAQKKPPETLFGLDVRPASMPDDIAGAALAEAEAGRYTAALSLLYRGTLIELIHRKHIEFRSGDTEDLCLRRASGRIDAQAALYFARLLDAWKRTAYAETPPDAASARDLCLRWAEHFAKRSEAA